MTTAYSDVSNIFKDLYMDSPAVYTSMFKDKPLSAWLPMEHNVPGQIWLQTVGYSWSSGVSATFATAQANASLPNAARFSISPVDIYGVESIYRKTMLQTASDKGALVNLVKDKFKLLLESLAQKLQRDIYRSGTGAIGTRSSASTNVITLTNAADAANFFVGQRITASATDGGALRTGSTYVTKVSRGRTTSTITLNSAAAITSFADGDTLYMEGFAANNSTNVSITGLNGWIPAAAVTSTSFLGVDRTIDEQNLAGSRINASTETLNARDSIEALITEVQTISGGRPEVIFTTPRIAEAVRIASSDAIRFVQVKGNHELMIDGFEILGVPVVADYACVPGCAWALSKDALCLKTTGGKFPEIVDEDGSNQLRVYNADAFEMRSSNYLNLVVKQPLKLGVAYNIPST